MRRSKSQSDQSPWGRVAGLLTACAVTLVGVMSGLDPHVILIRAAISSLVVGVVVAVGVSLVRVTRETPQRGLRHSK